MPILESRDISNFRRVFEYKDTSPIDDPELLDFIKSFGLSEGGTVRLEIMIIRDSAKNES